MAQETVHLNLARKWRSKQFDTVIGQELSLRILQNSLYLNQFFPVYLLSGQRGCGKTTTARLFAGAVNCQKLELFQKNPKLSKVPCLDCASCNAMSAGSHPDFIEIDAASHTGVDNIRNIIESASLLPVLGRKKIYLIDEAHMLSKAAFNAFLKILEEPPASVLFMLATTDPHKIIETVRSRCFQLFFTSIPTPIMVNHLIDVCAQENIPCDQAALHIIACETEGSARDALNLLEQVRFSHTRVTADAVLKVLGHMSEKLLLDLFDMISQGNIQGLMQLIETCSFEQYVPMAVWRKSTEVVRALLSYKQKVKNNGLFEDTERLEEFSKRLSTAHLIKWLRQLYTYELLLLRTTVSHSMLEMLFIELCGQSDQEELPVIVQKQGLPLSVAPVHKAPVEVPKETLMPEFKAVQSVQVFDERWEKFMAGAREFSDPLLQSIFKQAHFKEYNAATSEVIVIFAREATFFAAWVHDTKSVWETILHDAFGKESTLKLVFETAKTTEAGDGVKQVVQTPSSSLVQEKKITPAATQKQGGADHNARYRPTVSKAQEVKKELLVDISDTQKWQKAHLLKEAFGGSVVEAQGDEIYDETEL